MNQQYEFTLTGVSDRLIQVCPIHSGWSVIGRTDKYLSAAAVKITSVQPDEITLTFHEAGPFGIWLARGVPVSGLIKFVDQGGSYFTADWVQSEAPENLTLTISKKNK